MPPDTGGDARGPARRGLQEHVGHTLGPAGKDDEIGGAIPVREALLRDLADQPHAGAETERPDLGLQVGLEMPVARDCTLERCAVARDEGYGLHQHIQPFDGHQVAYEQDQGFCVGDADLPARRLARAGTEERPVDPVIHNVNPRPVDAEHYRLVAQIAADGDDGVRGGQRLGCSPAARRLVVDRQHIRAMNLDGDGQPALARQLHGRPAVGIGPAADDDIRTEVADRFPEAAADALHQEPAVQAAQDLGCKCVAGMVDRDFAADLPAIGRQRGQGSPPG